LEEAWQTMATLQKEGKVRWIGVSNFNVEQLKRAEKIAPVTSLQPPYSLIRRQIEAGILPYCEKRGIGVISYSPMASGLLTGAMTRERAAALPANDFRSRGAEFKEPRLSKNIELVERLRQVGQRLGRSPGVIVGARNAKQVEGVVGAADVTLSKQDISEIEGAAAIAAAR
jgi:aryl-alcohol dehydrogenase-like predicted oxidoreductase